MQLAINVVLGAKFVRAQSRLYHGQIAVLPYHQASRRVEIAVENHQDGCFRAAVRSAASARTRRDLTSHSEAKGSAARTFANATANATLRSAPVPTASLNESKAGSSASMVIIHTSSSDEPMLRREPARVKPSLQPSERQRVPSATPKGEFMADDPKVTRPQDAQRINVNQDHELQYWSERFGVSSDELKRAVSRVGPMAADVERALGRQARA
jgi:hypothetical protein